MIYPSLSALRTFEMAARLGSFKEAARALNISATAVSHAIRGLEEDIGVALFRRQTRKVELTDAGRLLARGCEGAFEQIYNTVNTIQPRKTRETVTIALSPLLASRWLTPRLSSFWATFPGIDLKLIHTSARIEPDLIDADVCLTWGDGSWPGLVARKLLEVSAVPVASRAFIDRHGPPETNSDLLRFPLFHQRDKTEWTDWFQAAGVPLTEALPGITIEDANVVLKNAIDGRGVSLGWRPLVDEELSTGQLLVLSEVSCRSLRAFYTVVAPARSNRAIVGRIVDWIQNVDSDS